MMRLECTIGNKTYRLGQPVDLSVALDFHGKQPNAYGVPHAAARPYAGEGFVLDTREGGACNCEVLEFIPHCQGTHTESCGHLMLQRYPIAAVLPEPFLPCSVISVKPEGRNLEAASIEQALAKTDPQFLQALVVRTLPNPLEKTWRSWEDATTPYFTQEAMTVVRKREVNHLLIDLPSLDPLRDDGLLAAHRIFWEMASSSKEIPHELAARRTVTEMIYVPDSVPDGQYLLTIQLPHFVSDAAPSRPILFFLEKIG